MAGMDEDFVFATLRDKLFTAVVGDVLDKMGSLRSSCRKPSTAEARHEICRPGHAGPRGRHFR